MTDNPEILSPGSANVADATLRHYLLCDLADSERYELDERLLTDDEFAQRISLAESELIDDYVSGRLEPADRDRFFQEFLISEGRKEKVRFASALTEYAESQSARTAAVPAIIEARTAWREKVAAFFGFNPGPAWAFAAAAVVLIVGIGLIWLMTRQSQRPRPVVATREAVQSLPPQAPSQSDAPPAPVSTEATAKTKPDAKTSPSERMPPPSIATFVLMPGALRGPGQMTRVAVPRGERDILRLSLVLENPTPGPYLAELANANGQTVAVKNNLQPHSNGHAKVTFEVPARLIQTDDYQVKLQRKTDGKIESVGRYYFRALPE